MSEAFLDCGVEITLVGSNSVSLAGIEMRTNERFEPENFTTSVRNAGFYKPGKMQAVRVLDIGTGGISFESTEAMSTGQKVELRIDTPVKNGIRAMGRVKYCIRWASNYRIGVAFSEISGQDKRFLTKEFFQSL